jgi:transcriptional regulator with XRE-family HTH domain
MHRLGPRLRNLRGQRSLAAFAKALDLSYTFVREMERGNRLPSDEVLVQLAERLQVDAGELALLTYCDRSELLAEHLGKCGIPVAPAVLAPIAPTPNRPPNEPVTRTM